jgi:ADP-ribose pyrophosphatase YjhB (NUDIX family)
MFHDHRARPVRLVCSVIVEDGDSPRLLLIPDPKGAIPGKWNQPNGVIEGDESPEQSALRIVKELTGYDTEIKGLQRLYIIPKIDTYTINFCFIARIIPSVDDGYSEDPVEIEKRWVGRDDVHSVKVTELRHRLSWIRMNDWAEGHCFTDNIILEVSQKDTQ